MLNKIKNLFNKQPKKAEKPIPPKVIKSKEISAKEKATLAGEPYVNIISVDIDPNNINNGAFELDWNSIFITQLVKAGYMKKKEDTDNDIVDRWFQDVCRNIVLEVYDQQQADPTNRDLIRPIQTRDIGNGRTEVS
jgi:hypothetical protein